MILSKPDKLKLALSLAQLSPSLLLLWILYCYPGGMNHSVSIVVSNIMLLWGYQSALLWWYQMYCYYNGNDHSVIMVLSISVNMLVSTTVVVW